MVSQLLVSCHNYPPVDISDLSQLISLIRCGLWTWHDYLGKLRLLYVHSFIDIDINITVHIIVYIIQIPMISRSINPVTVYWGAIIPRGEEKPSISSRFLSKGHCDAVVKLLKVGGIFRMCNGLLYLQWELAMRHVRKCSCIGTQSIMESSSTRSCLQSSLAYFSNSLAGTISASQLIRISVRHIISMGGATVLPRKPTWPGLKLLHSYESLLACMHHLEMQ